MIWVLSNIIAIMTKMQMKRGFVLYWLHNTDCFLRLHHQKKDSRPNARQHFITHKKTNKCKTSIWSRATATTVKQVLIRIKVAIISISISLVIVSIIYTHVSSVSKTKTPIKTTIVSRVQMSLNLLWWMPCTAVLSQIQHVNGEVVMHRVKMHNRLL